MCSERPSRKNSKTSRRVRPAVPFWCRAEDVGAGRYRTRFQNLTFHLMGYWGRSEIWVWWWCSADLVTKSCPTVVTPWTVAHQVPLSMGFPTQECWSGLPFPSPEGSSFQPRVQTYVSCIGRCILYHWATREAHLPPYCYVHYSWNKKANFSKTIPENCLD